MSVSVRVLVVQIRSVVVAVLQGFMAMQMRVFADDGWNVAVQVMAVVVAVSVFVFEHFMPVRVLMSFGQMQVGAQGEERH